MPRNNQKVTKTVSVATGEHVAHIIGKTGSKIKRLREVTKTWIKTPLVGDEPTFVVSGSEANVDKVIMAIQKTSDFFTKLIEKRNIAFNEKEVTIFVPVPKQYIGVVIGQNGTTILKISERTETRISSPKPHSQIHAFKVMGTQNNVMSAKEAIHQMVFKTIHNKSSLGSVQNRDTKECLLNEITDRLSNLAKPRTQTKVRDISDYNSDDSLINIYLCPSLRQSLSP